MLGPLIWGLVSTQVDYWLLLTGLVLLVSLVNHTHSSSTIKSRKCFNHRSRKAATVQQTDSWCILHPINPRCDLTIVVSEDFSDARTCWPFCSAA